mmetsp:Transcript_81905/g.163062  ORF Transcript_81905/g.163062 Transcript_81905/m.163062 type:complete len:201 (+) Transcript_81905:569-1171(+)
MSTGERGSGQLCRSAGCGVGAGLCNHLALHVTREHEAVDCVVVHVRPVGLAAVQVDGALRTVDDQVLTVAVDRRVRCVQLAPLLGCRVPEPRVAMARAAGDTECAAVEQEFRAAQRYERQMAAGAGRGKVVQWRELGPCVLADRIEPQILQGQRPPPFHVSGASKNVKAAQRCRRRRERMPPTRMRRVAILVRPDELCPF